MKICLTTTGVPKKEFSGQKSPLSHPRQPNIKSPVTQRYF